MLLPKDKDGAANPHDLSLHQQVKEISDLLRPELLRLYNNPKEIEGNVELYLSLIAQIKTVKKEVSNHDALFAFQNMLSHIQTAIEMFENKKSNREVLWHLQEVMALLFKVQNLPS